ncbi:MAG: hypothetical protein ABJM29_00510 [Rhizobiaceae bacterium]
MAEGNEAGEGPLVATGNLGINFGENAGPTPTLTFDVNFAGIPLDSSGAPLSLSSDGVALEFTIVDNADGGQTLTAANVGTGGTIFSVVLDIVPRAVASGASGANYVFTLENNLDHQAGGASDDELPISFSFTATDSDGEIVGATFTVNISDDDVEIGAPIESSVDEDGLTNGNIDSGYDGDIVGSELSVTEDLAISWGADDANTDIDGGVTDGTGDRAVNFTDTANAAANITIQGSEGAIAAADLTSRGDAITYKFDNDSGILIATADLGAADEREVFRVTLSDTGTGSYTFLLNDVLDHSTAGTEDDLFLIFNFTATDSDGDPITSTFSVVVDDDGPVFTAAAENSQVDEEGLVGGATVPAWMTRCTVDAKRLFVHRARRSPMLHTRVPGMGGAAIQSPDFARTCRPPLSSCSKTVNTPKSV